MGLTKSEIFTDKQNQIAIFAKAFGHPARVASSICEITEVVPRQKLTYSWIYEGYEGITYVTFELFEEDKKTRLKLTHTGFETFPISPFTILKQVGATLSMFRSKGFLKENIRSAYRYFLIY